MDLSEKEIEDYIFKDLTENDGNDCENRGLHLPSFLCNNRIIWERQLNIDPYGIIDIVGFYRCDGVLHVDLLELKACPIDSNHFDQIFRYREGLLEYIRGTFKSIQISFNSFLVGNGYSGGRYIQNNSPVSVVEFEYDLNGISFTKHRIGSRWHVPSERLLTFRKQKLNGKKVH